MQPIPRRRARAVAHLHAHVLAVIDAAPIREAALYEDGMLLFGFCHTDRSITINTKLLRTAVGLHELIHRAHPEYGERTVREKTRLLLHSLSDDALDVLHSRLVAAIRVGSSPKRA